MAKVRSNPGLAAIEILLQTWLVARTVVDHGKTPWLPAADSVRRQRQAGYRAVCRAGLSNLLETRFFRQHAGSVDSQKTGAGVLLSLLFSARPW